MRPNIRKTARWGEDEPLSEQTERELIERLSAEFGADKVRRAVLVCPVAVEKVIDNEKDARQTIRNLERRGRGG